MKLAKLFILYTLIFNFQNVFAFKFTPMVSEMNIDQDGSKLKFSLLNNSDKTIAVQVRAAHRRVDEEGIEYRKEAKDEFLIFPNQLFLKGNEKRSILVRYKGNPKI